MTLLVMSWTRRRRKFLRCSATSFRIRQSTTASSGCSSSALSTWVLMNTTSSSRSAWRPWKPAASIMNLRISGDQRSWPRSHQFVLRNCYRMENRWVGLTAIELKQWSRNRTGIRSSGKEASWWKTVRLSSRGKYRHPEGVHPHWGHPICGKRRPRNFAIRR